MVSGMPILVPREQMMQKCINIVLRYLSSTLTTQKDEYNITNTIRKQNTLHNNNIVSDGGPKHLDISIIALLQHLWVITFSAVGNEGAVHYVSPKAPASNSLSCLVHTCPCIGVCVCVCAPYVCVGGHI